MLVINEIKAVRSFIKEQRGLGRSIGFVPTMGALHEGHLSLLRRSALENDLTVVSIFVNPLQFGENEDLDTYPRTLEADIKAAASAGAGLLFAPTAREILGERMLAFVDILELQDNLCGRSRPGHFRGVCTIVAKLFNIVTPDRAYFGQKDIQQYIILERMVQDLNFNIQMIRCPIVREPDGLAMSSRNKYLSATERQDALVLFQSLQKGRQLFEKGVVDAHQIIAELKGMIEKVDCARLDYASIVDENMHDVDTVKEGNILALAVFIGTTRLIDNMIFGDPQQV